MRKLYPHFFTTAIKSRIFKLFAGAFIFLMAMVPGKMFAQADPQSFTATPASDVQINLAATANIAGDNIIVVFNSTNTFGALINGTSYLPGDPITGGGTVLYVGTATGLTNQTGLIANTQYFYEAFSDDASNNYSPGITANATTCATLFTTSGGGSYCSGGTGVTITLSGSEIGVSYQLKNGSGNVGSPVVGTGSLLNFNNITAADTYTIDATNSDASCTLTMNGSATVTIDPLLPVSVGIVSDAPGDAICAGSSITFTATPTNGGASPLYQWQINGLNTGVNSSVNTFTSSSLTNGSVISVVLTSNATPCATGSPATSNFISVTVNLVPTVVITNPAAVCSPSTVDLTAAAVTAGSTAGLTYTYWTDAGATSSYATPTTAGVGTYYIKGTTASGCFDIKPVTVTINPTPTVVITDPAAVCSPLTVDLTVAAVTAGSTAGLTYTYWTDAGATSSYATPTTAGAGTYYIKGTTASGCFDIKPVTVTVNPTPSVVITNPAAVCSPSTVDLTVAAVTAGSTAGLTYTYWTDAGATSSYTTPTTAGAGTYYIKGTTALGCFDIKPVTVIVDAIPTVVITNPAAVCSPSTVNLTVAAVTAGSTAGLTYTYWTDAGATSSYTTPTTAGAGTYYIKGTTAAGCFDIKPVTVTVNPTPTVVTTNPAAVCSPSTVNLTVAAVTAGSTAGLTYTYWTDAGATSSYATPTTAGAGTYYIKGTTALGCFDIKPVIVTVNPTPTVVITNPAAVCSPSTVNLTAAAVTAGSTAGLTYTYWTDAGATSSYATPATAGAGTYYIKGTTALGCFDIKPVIVTVNPTPTVVITNPAAVCSPSTVNLTTAAVTSGSTAGLTFTYWTNAAATISYATPATAAAGTYYIKGTTASGCFDIQPVTVTVNPTPTVVITNPAAVCSPSTVNLTAVAVTSGSTAGLTFTYWTNAAATISYATPATAAAGTYYIKGTTASGCFDIQPVTVTVNPTVTPSVVISASSTSICSGTSVTFTASPTNGGSPSYQWKNGAANVGGNSATYTTTTLANNASISVVMTSNAACVTPTTATSNSIVMTVYTGSPNNSGGPPANRLITGPSSICPGATATGLIYKAPSNLSNTATYTWTVPSGFTITAGAGTSQITVSVPGPGAVLGPNTISLKATNPCDLVGITINFTVNINSFNAINVGPDFSMCVGTNPTLTNVVSGGASRVTWVASTGTVSGGPYPTPFVYTPPPLFSGTVTLTANTDTAAGTCTPAESFGSDQVIITVNQPSVAPTSLSASIATICNGDNTTLTQTGGSLGTGATWKWYSNAAFTTLVGTGVGANASLTVSPATTTTYYLRAESSTGAPCAANVAAATNVTVTVNQPSVAPTTLNASLATICNGGSSTLTQTGGSLGTGASWKWYSDNTFTTLVGTGAGVNASLSVNPTTATTYYLRAESSTGAPCTANVAAATSVTVAVNDPSVAPTGLSASTPVICNGDNTTLTQTGGSLGTGATWKWYSNAAFTTLVGTGVGANASLTVSPAATTTYYLRAESSTGAPCAANVAAATNVTVTVNQPSVAPTTLNASLATICNGGSSTLTQTGGSLGTGASWKWYSDNTFTTLVGTGAGANASLSVNPTTATTYYLRAESSTGAPCTANVAAATSVTVAVNDPSVAPTSLSASIATICNGDNTTLTQTGGSLGTGATWKWYSNAAFTTLVGTGVGANASLSVSPATTTTYYLRAESSTGAPCAANVAAATNVTVTVNQPSVAPTTLNASLATICNGGSSTLTQTGGSLGTGASWKWYSDNTFTTLVGTGAGANASLSVNPTTATTYYLRAESSTGAPCTANVAAATSVTVAVNQPSVAPTGLSASTPVICNGDNITLTQTGGSLGTGAAWKWYSNAAFTTLVGTGVGANASLSVSPATTTTYYLRAESSTGAPCAANVAAATNVTVTVNQPPFITTQPNPSQTVCSSFPVSFSVAAMGTGLTYQWFLNGNPLPNGGTISGATSATLNISQAALADAGTYTVVVSGASPCTSVTSNNADLTVNQSIAINTQPVSQTVCEGTPSVTFNVAATGTISSYVWRRNGIPVSGGNYSGNTTSTLTITGVLLGNAGNFDVVISSPSGSCSQIISSPPAVLAVTPTVGTPTAITISAGAEPTCQLTNGTTTTTYATTATNNTGLNWSLSNGAAGTINASTGVMTWANGFSGSVNIQVTANGCNGPSAQVIRTVNITPTVGIPTAITVSAGVEPSCQLTNGTTTTTYATTATNNTGFNWSLSNPAAGTINASTGLMMWANGFSGSVDIQVTANGCNGPSAQVIRTVTITPTVGTPTAIIVSAGAEPTCQLTNGTTTTTYATTATNNTGFNWSLSNPAAGTINASTGVMTWANGFSGTVNIQVTANGCNGPSAQVIRTVTITPTVGTPTAITVSAGVEPTCQLTNGTTTTTYATTATNNTGFNWSLSNPAAGAINASTGVMTWANGFSGSVNIQVTANGCNSPSAQVIRTVTITPTVGTPTAITISAGAEPTCQLTNGTTTTTYATTATNNTGFNWSLSNPAAGTINASTGVMTWANGFSGTVNIQVTANGCNGPSAQVIRTVTITPTVGTPTAITVSAGVEPTCQLTNGTTTTTYATTATNNTGFNWSLSNPAAGAINASTGVMTWANGFSGSVNIQVTANGCNSPSAQVIRTVSITPTVGTPVFTLGATSTRCQGPATITYGATATNTTGITYSLDAASLGAGNTISAGTGAVTYSATWTGTSVITASAAGCSGPTTATHTVTITPTSVGGTIASSQIICQNATPADLTLSGNTGAVLEWQKAADPNFATTITHIANTTTTLSGATIGSLATTAYFRAVIQSSPCSNAFSSVVTIAVNPPFTPIINVSPSTTICLGQMITLSTTGFNARDTILGGDFSNANPPGWSGGSANNSNGATNSNWGEATGGKVYGTTIYSSGAPSGGKFQTVDGTTTNGSQTDILTTPSFSTIGRTALSLQWYQGYNFNGAASGSVQVSIDGGVTFTTLATYNSSSPVVATNPFNSLQTVNLNAYLGQPNVKIRFFYTGTANSNWAVDDVNVVGPYQPVTYTWPGGFTVSAKGDTATITPSPAGTYTYNITTTTTCGSTTTPVTIVVNPLPTITGTLSVCIGATTQLTGSATPAAVNPWVSATPAVATINNTGLVTGVTSGTSTITYTNSNGCSITAPVTVNPLPTITIAGSTPTVCSATTAQTTTLAYSAVSNAPTTYSIIWNAAATTAGFTPVTNAALPASPISITIPANVAANTYTGTITVKNANGCSSSSGTAFTVTVNAPASITTQPAAATFCAGGNVTFNIVATGTGITYQWQVSTDGITYSNISGAPYSGFNSNTLTITNVNGALSGNYYKVIVSTSAPCNTPATSNAVQLLLNNYWTGATSTDWNTAGNWSGNVVPTTACPDVYIPSVAKEPIVGNAVPAITNLHILAGATVTINNTGTLTLGGTISEINPNSIIAGNGTVNLNGAGAQTIPAATFNNNALGNLVISNTNASGVTLGGPLDIYQSVTYSAGGTTLATNGNLTLKSLKTGTAYLGDMTGHTINGDVTVERYIATGTASPDHPKSWQFLAIPTQGQTIHQSWQENCAATAACVLGYGTQITGAGGTGAGFDATTADPTMKVYNSATNGYTGVAGTGIPIYNQKGYFVFVRGDRSVTNPFAPATETVLRTKGTLFTPTPLANRPPSTTVNANSFESIGNPYAAPIDMRKIGRTGDVIASFIIWDPRLGGSNGYGAFRTLTQIGSDYYAVPGDGTGNYPGFPTPTNYIQSGQAFLAQTLTGGASGTVTFDESAKVGGSVLFTTPNPVEQTPHLLNTSLFQLNANGSTTLVDGVLNNFNDSYSNGLDALDARKSMNSTENLAIKTGGKLLVVESRHTITAQDTIFFNLTGVSARAYQFHFDAENLDPSVQGVLIDNYQKTRTPLNMTGITEVNFTVANVTGSNAANRFMIVFEPAKALPVTFTSIKAWSQDKNIDVQWRVDNEMNMKQYEVEKSTNGTQFSSIAVKAATANNGGSAVYVIADASPVEGYNYYRVKSMDVNGKTSYTNVVKVLMGSMKQDITIYPNPITDGMIHLRLMNEPEGKYNIRLLNKLGQLIVQKQITHAGGNATELIKWDYNLAHGMYQLEVTKPDGTVKDLNVMY